MRVQNAPVAQLDRVSASEAEGRAFESRQARHSFLSGSESKLFKFSDSLSMLVTIAEMPLGDR